MTLAASEKAPMLLNGKRLKFIIFFVSLIFIAVLISLGYFNKTESFMMIAILLSVITCIFDSFEHGFYLLFGLSIFENGFVFRGIHGLVPVLCVVLIKFLLNKPKRLNGGFVIPLFGLLLLELVNDSFQIGLNGTLLQIIVQLSLLFFLIPNLFLYKFNIYKLFFTYSSLFLVAMIFTMMDYGGLLAFIKYTQANEWVRLGLNVGDLCGGAMAIPIYSAFVISLSIPVLFYCKPHLACVFCIIVIDAISLFCGMFTISRSFFFCLIVAVALFLFLKPRNNTGKLKFFMVIIVSVLLIVLLAVFHNVVQIALDKLFGRIDSDASFSGERFDIYTSSLAYLFENPVALFLGRGAYGYQDIGHQYGYLFSAGCHNFYLDLLMSWGIAGTLFCGCLFFTLMRKSDMKFAIKQMPYSSIPFFVVLAFSLTAFRTTSIKPFLLLVVSIIIPITFIQNNPKNKKEAC